MSKTYRTSDILFGTREKYLELRKQLLLLESLTKINYVEGNKLEYDVFSTGQKNEQGVRINHDFLCRLKENPNIVACVINGLRQGFLLASPVMVDYSDLIKDENGIYRFKDANFNDMVSITDQEKFSEIIAQIRNMEFFNKMGTKKIYKDLDNWWNCVTLGLGGLAVSHLINGNRLGHLNYHLHSDTIRAHTLNGRNLHRITSNQVRELLDVEVDESKLTDYQKELIDDSESTKKEIVIDDCKEKVADFDIEEYSDAIHLVKRKGFYRNF